MVSSSRYIILLIASRFQAYGLILIVVIYKHNQIKHRVNNNFLTQITRRCAQVNMERWNMEQYYYVYVLVLVASASPIATTHNVQNRTREYRDLSYSIYTLYQQYQFDDQKRHERPIIPSFERDIQFYFILSQRTAIQYIHAKHKKTC